MARMVTRSNVRLGLTGALFLMIFGAFSGCSDASLTGVETAQDAAEECIIIEGIIHCAPDR
jgi:hypothetical protein